MPEPGPRHEFVTDELPTSAVIDRELGGSYEFPALNRSIGTVKSPAVLQWTRFYDDVELELGAATWTTTKHTTHFTPELAGPQRVRRNELIGEARALSLVPSSTMAKLLYSANMSRRRLAGRKGDNALDYIAVVESWRLVYAVDTPHSVVMIDAYTGEQVRIRNKN